MQNVNSLPSPWFELKGPLSRIDLSAWISGLSYALGLLLIGQVRLAEAIIQDPVRLLILPITYAAFLFAVLRIQKHMRLALTATTFGSPVRLTTSGIFRFSRNPIYVAFLLPLVALASLSLFAGAAAALFYVTTMTFTVIRSEERELAATFGNDFTNYMAKTPRWLV